MTAVYCCCLSERTTAQDAGRSQMKYPSQSKLSSLLEKKANSRRFWIRSFLFSYFSKIKERVRNVSSYLYFSRQGIKKKRDCSVYFWKDFLLVKRIAKQENNRIAEKQNNRPVKLQYILITNQGNFLTKIKTSKGHQNIGEQCKSTTDLKKWTMDDVF